jgi:hypothetical protein
MRMKMISTAILFFLGFLFVSPPGVRGESVDGLGTWVWSASALATEEARQELVEFCRENCISHVDVHAKMSWDGETPALQAPAPLRDFILLAGGRQISTAIVRGDPRMFFLANHERARKELRAIISFSRTLPPGALLKGVKYDVEPYSTTEWKSGGTARESVVRDYLTFLREARSLLKEEAPGLWLAADIPFWWDRDEFIVEFGGETKRLSEHVQDLTDFIVIMSYWRSAQKVFASVERERDYAERTQKIVHPALETIQLKKDPHTSFWGLPAEDLWNTVKQLQERAVEDPALGGVMIHSYRGLREKLRSRNPERPDAGQPDRRTPPASESVVQTVYR